MRSTSRAHNEGSGSLKVAVIFWPKFETVSDAENRYVWEGSYSQDGVRLHFQVKPGIAWRSQIMFIKVMLNLLCPQNLALASMFMLIKFSWSLKRNFADSISLFCITWLLQFFVFWGKLLCKGVLGEDCRNVTTETLDELLDSLTPAWSQCFDEIVYSDQLKQPLVIAWWRLFFWNTCKDFANSTCLTFVMLPAWCILPLLMVLNFNAWIDDGLTRVSWKSY